MVTEGKTLGTVSLELSVAPGRVFYSLTVPRRLSLEEFKTLIDLLQRLENVGTDYEQYCLERGGGAS
jgi:hypothetical protein